MSNIETLPNHREDRFLEEHTLPCALRKSASLYADRPALCTLESAPVTYGELYSTVGELGQWLQEKGIQSGDKVAILADNSPHWGIAYFAVTCMGAVAVPILTEFHPDAITHIIRHSDAKAIFVSDRYLPKIEDASFGKDFICIDIENLTLIEELTDKAVLKKFTDASFREFRKLKDKAMKLMAKRSDHITENDTAAIIYTSGTTGHSKGVQLTHKNIVFTAAATDGTEVIFPTDKFFSILPLAHTYECTLGLVLPIINGASITYLGKPPTARVLLPALAEAKPTVMLSVPLVIEKIYKNSIAPKLAAKPLTRFLMKFYLTRKLVLKAAGKKLGEALGGHIRCLVISGAPLTSDVEKFLYDSGFPYIVGYGLTETSPTCSVPKISTPRLGSSGYALNGVAIRIASPDPHTGIGEVEIHGDNVMEGYFKLPELTEEVITEDGWFKTGDLGNLDKDGYLFIRGRSKNMLLGPSGENIYPEEIESFFFEYPYVNEVLVYMGSGGKLTARVHLNETYLDESLGSLSVGEQRAAIVELLEKTRGEVNKKGSSFSRVHRIIQQVDPFEKTPTQKIKRYLYVDE